MNGNDQGYSDISADSWIVRSLPPAIRPYALLARWDRPVGIHLLFIPCLFGFLIAPGWPDNYQTAFFYIFLCLIGAWLMRGAGCTINDLWDREFDAQVERTARRPLASGVLSVHQAMVFALIQTLLAGALLMLFPLPAIITAVAALPLVLAYPLMKRLIWWPQLFLGLTFNWGILVGFMTLGGEWNSPILWLFYGGAVLWTIGYDTIYAYQDIVDDQMIGIKSTARLFGQSGKIITSAFLIAAGGLWIWALCLIPLYGLTAPLIITLVLTLYLWLVLRPLDLRSRPDCLSAFKVHILLGYAVAAGMVLDLVTRIQL